MEKYSESEKSVGYLAYIKYSKIYLDRFIIYVPKGSIPLSSGDVIKGNTSMLKNKYYKNYNEFNLSTNLHSKGIVSQIYLNSFEMIDDKEERKKYSDEFIDYLNLKFDMQKSSIIQAMILGEKDMLDENVKEEFNMAGISHLLVVSGTAIMILKKMIKNVLKRKGKIYEYIEIIIITMYVIFCKFSISIFRAYLNNVISFLALKFNIKINKIQVFLSSFLFLLLINPYYIFSISFWYTNLAVLGIITIYPKLQSKCQIWLLKKYRVKNEQKVKGKISYKIAKYSINLSVLSISIQIMLFPLNVYFGNTIYLFSVISNIAVNITYVIEYYLCFLLVIFFKVPVIADLISFVIALNTDIIVIIARIFSKMSVFSIILNKLNFLAIISMYVIILYFVYGYIINFKIKYRFKKKRHFKIFSICLWTALITIILVSIIYSNFIAFVYFFNIGQGNMSVIMKGKTVIVSDIGSTSTDVKYILLNFLDAYNIKEIDYVFLSHMHMDHINGLISLKEDLESGSLKINNICVCSINDEISSICKKFGINVIELKRGDILNIDGIKVEILSPSNQNEIHAKDMLNANSMVSKFEINGKKLLYMGDATIETEAVLTSLYEEEDYYILQVGHHGSSTSSSKEFLEKFKFKYGIISSEKAKYSHPSAVTLENLFDAKVKCKVLEQSGGVRFWLY
ncbi:MAG: ComEC/Rec2 family competence protein [Clostridia bacterium]|nr:ComEC/Rec2 family competence protein [Clostridia bacterium]